MIRMTIAWYSRGPTSCGECASFEIEKRRLSSVYLPAGEDGIRPKSWSRLGGPFFAGQAARRPGQPAQPPACCAVIRSLDVHTRMQDTIRMSSDICLDTTSLPLPTINVATLSTGRWGGGRHLHASHGKCSAEGAVVAVHTSKRLQVCAICSRCICCTSGPVVENTVPVRFVSSCLIPRLEEMRAQLAATYC